MNKMIWKNLCVGIAVSFFVFAFASDCLSSEKPDPRIFGVVFEYFPEHNHYTPFDYFQNGKYRGILNLHPKGKTSGEMSRTYSGWTLLRVNGKLFLKLYHGGGKMLLRLYSPGSLDFRTTFRKNIRGYRCTKISPL